MSKQREALELALEALEIAPLDHNSVKSGFFEKRHYAIIALREALAQPEPVSHHSEDDLDMVINAEPVAWMCPHDPERETAFSWRAGMRESSGCGHQRVPLYTAPPARKSLTDEQIDAEFDRECWVTVVFADGARGIALDKVTARDFARSIERAHGIGGEK